MSEDAATDPVSAELHAFFAEASAALRRNRPLATLGTPAPPDPKLSMSQGEIDALEAVGAFRPGKAVREATGPLARSHAEYMALLAESLSVDDVARLLGVESSRVRQRLRERSLYGIQYQGKWRLPRFQFEHGLVLPGLASVLAELPEDLTALELVDWFLLPNPDLEVEGAESPLAPRAWLAWGRPAATVAALARTTFG